MFVKLKDQSTVNLAVASHVYVIEEFQGGMKAAIVAEFPGVEKRLVLFDAPLNEGRDGLQSVKNTYLRITANIEVGARFMDLNK